ncbi:MAG TPA: non-homologous end-joining DNA ligase [Steroidobacteraceae bacterium]|nr:non-homologous end-joining DNA ligase [Steroidobacteraceae bacterium]
MSAALARKSALPAHVELQLARLVEAAPAGPGWLHEVKFDGYRVLIWRDRRGIRVSSRGGQDWTERLGDAVSAARLLPCESCILDGELVALDAKGLSDFGLLQRRLGNPHRAAQLRVMVFDLLFLDGEDLRGLPLMERKRRLEALLPRAAGALQLSPYTSGNGPAAARAACEAGLEGIVSKAAASPYEGGRAGAWLKCKCVQSDEYAIVGYTAGQGARAHLGSLLLGSPGGGGSWRYRGRVGTGLNERMIADLLGRLETSSRPPRFVNPPTRAQLRGRSPIWVTPKLVAEIEFRGTTGDGLLRQPSFKGLRRDRSVASLRPGERDTAEVSAPARRPGPPKAPGVRRSRRSLRRGA